MTPSLSLMELNKLSLIAELDSMLKSTHSTQSNVLKPEFKLLRMLNNSSPMHRVKKTFLPSFLTSKLQSKISKKPSQNVELPLYLSKLTSMMFNHA